jgi:hypothetical protein
MFDTKKCLIAIGFSICFDNFIRSSEVNQDGLQLYGTLLLMAYADDYYILGEKVHRTEKK